MKEIMRMDHVTMDDRLDRYCITAYEGDVIYIQSLMESSLRAIMEILSGKSAPEQGNLYRNEKRVTAFGYEEAKSGGCYVVTYGVEFVEKMTVADNMIMPEPALRLFSRKRNAEKVRAYFAREQVNLDPNLPVWKLTGGERRKLGVLRAKYFGARLVLLDMSRIQAEGKTADEICEIILRMKREGTTFLILSTRYTPVAETADRIQYLADGRDIMEWRGLDENLRTMLMSGDFRGRISAFPKRTEQSKPEVDAADTSDGKGYPGFLHAHSGLHQTTSRGQLIGMYDYEWEISDGIYAYLHRVKESAPEIWNTCIRAKIPQDDELPVSFSNEKPQQAVHTVVIPTESADLLLENLSIRENLTITAGKRIAVGRYGLIHRRMEDNLVSEICRRTGIPTDGKTADLSKVQRVLITIARWEMTRPQVMILELPFRGLNPMESGVLRDYLISLCDRGIRVICLTKSREIMFGEFDLILRTRNGERAEIDTK